MTMDAATLHHVRRPAVAGAFYPAAPGALAAMVDGLLARWPEPGPRPRALVVPHAGYVYSGPVAAAAYATLREGPPVRRVVIAGPAHYVPLAGRAVPRSDAWATPLGEVPVDAGLRDLARRLGARVDDAPHLPEHSLEVQVPFLQRLLGEGLSILPVVVGDGPVNASAACLYALAADADLLVISTDLSHYEDDRTARRLDAATLDAALSRDPAAIRDDGACGLFALRAALAWARDTDLDVRLLAYGTSADTGGPADRVVGYAALAIG